MGRAGDAEAAAACVCLYRAHSSSSRQPPVFSRLRLFLGGGAGRGEEAPRALEQEPGGAVASRPQSGGTVRSTGVGRDGKPAADGTGSRRRR